MAAFLYAWRFDGYNISTHLAIKDSAVIGSPKIYFDKYKFFVENPADGVKLGNAAGACETAVTTALSEQNLTSVVGSLWYQTIQDTLPLTVYVLTHCTNYNSTKDLYAAVIETDASGVPVQNASVKLEVVEPDESGICHLVLPGNNEHGYAVVFMQEGKQEAQIVKVTPADITVYTGGAGYTGTVGGSDTAIEGLPEPGFYVTLPDSLEQKLKGSSTGDDPVDLSGIVSFEGAAQGGASRTWILEKYDRDSNVTVTVDGEERYIYRLVPGAEQDIVRVQFTDENGKQVINDQFQIDLDALYQEYDMSIYTGDVIGSTVVAMTIFWPYPEGADSNDTFYVIHFDGLDRNYDDLSNALENNQPENCAVTRTSGGITFTVNSFSPFALV